MSERASEPGGSLDRHALRTVTVERAGSGAVEDWVAAEEPLEIRIGGQSLVVTLRTPGLDRDLAVGFLFTEGVISSRRDVISVDICRDPLAYDPDNVVDVQLTPESASRRQAIEHARREYLAAAACGLCGKARIEAIYQRLPSIPPEPAVDPELIQALPEKMEARQSLFRATGGLHGAALFDREGNLLALAEDVGRHNAVDKLIGASFLKNELPWRDRILVVSARAGFEIVQKAMMAQVSTMVAVGASSSLAVEAALRGGLDLYSFVRPGRSNRPLTIDNG